MGFFLVGRVEGFFGFVFIGKRLVEFCFGLGDLGLFGLGFLVFGILFFRVDVIRFRFLIIRC